MYYNSKLLLFDGWYNYFRKYFPSENLRILGCDTGKFETTTYILHNFDVSDSYRIGLAYADLHKNAYPEYQPGGAKHEEYRATFERLFVDENEDDKDSYLTADKKSLKPMYMDKNFKFDRNIRGWVTTRYPGKLKMGKPLNNWS